MLRIVYLDRDTLSPETVVRAPSVPHEMVVHARSAPNEVAERIRDADVVITNKAPVRAEALAGASKLKLIAVSATGTDIVDLSEVRARGIAVCNIRNYAKHTVPEHTFALMLALERLSPLERAAFLLHDVFDMEFAEIAAVLNRSEAACRQLASRARGNVRRERPRFETAPDRSAKIADAFFAALRSGDAGALRDALAEDAVFHADGGGRVRAARNILYGADHISRFFAGYARKGALSHPRWTRRIVVNGLPGELAVNADGVMQTTALEIRDGRVAAVYVTRNPDKLRHLEPLAPQ